MSEPRATLGVYVETRYKYRVSWFFDGDEGGTLGQSDGDGEGDPPSMNDPDSWEHWAASRAVKAAPGCERDSFGFYWESEAKAKAALRLAKAALKSGNKPLPDWAAKAIAAGWKPPRGWKP